MLFRSVHCLSLRIFSFSITTPGGYGRSKSQSMPKAGSNLLCGLGIHPITPNLPSSVRLGSKREFSIIYSLGLTFTTCSWDLHVTSSCHRIRLYSVNRTRPLTQMRLRQLEERGESFTPISKPLEFAIESREDYDAAWERNPREPLN